MGGADFGWDPEVEAVPDAAAARMVPGADESPSEHPISEHSVAGRSVLVDSVLARFSAAVGRLRSVVDELAGLAGEPGLGLAGSDELIGWTRELERCRNVLLVPEHSLINVMEAAGCRIDGPVGLVPDGMLEDRPCQDAVRGLEVHPIQRGMHRGMYRVEGRLAVEAGAKVSAVLDPLSKPQPVVDESGRVVEPDRRDRAVRMHDGLEEVMDRCLRAGDLPAHGGTPTTLILLAEEDDFVAAAAGPGESAPGQADAPAARRAEAGAAGRTGTRAGPAGSCAGQAGSARWIGRVGGGLPGSAVTETGDVLPIEMAVALSDEAEIVRTAFDRQTGEVLNLGRSRRLASYGQTLALAARDGGCTFPGCGKSPKWCQRHHIVDWVKGGPTDLANLTLVCSFHHYRFARHGWSAEYQQGRVWWRPPKIIDPDQKPILNLRYRDYPLIT